LDDIPDAELDPLAETGFDWIWFLSVWRTGLAGQRVSRSNPEWRREFAETLPDLREEDIAGSGFDIAGYTVHPARRGDAALARRRKPLQYRGLPLMLDFVRSHAALDHPWVEDPPAFYIPGTERRRLKQGPRGARAGRPNLQSYAFRRADHRWQHQHLDRVGTPAQGWRRTQIEESGASTMQAETGCPAASRRNGRIVELGTLAGGWGDARFGKNLVR